VSGEPAPADYRGRTWAALGIALLVAVLAVAWAGRVAEGRRSLAEADAAVARGDTFDAIMASRAAAEARCPTCTAPDEGYRRLEAIARDAEARGDDATAFAAWRAVRAALLATSAASTSSERRTRAEAAIARFGHRIDAAAVAAGSPPTVAAEEPRLAAALATRDVPSATAFAVVAAGALVFLYAAVRFVRGRTAAVADGVAAGAGAVFAAIGALFF